MKISGGSKKRCREKFGYKGIGKLINRATFLCELEEYCTEALISECIYDYDDPKFYNVLLYLLKDNLEDEKLLKELEIFEYKELD